MKPSAHLTRPFKLEAHTSSTDSLPWTNLEVHTWLPKPACSCEDLRCALQVCRIQEGQPCWSVPACIMESQLA